MTCKSPITCSYEKNYQIVTGIGLCEADEVYHECHLGPTLDYDMNAEQLATDLRREALNSLFGLLISEQQSAGDVAAAQAGSGSGDGSIFSITPGGITLNPNSALNRFRLGGR